MMPTACAGDTDTYAKWLLSDGALSLFGEPAVLGRHLGVAPNVFVESRTLLPRDPPAQTHGSLAESEERNRST
jgi:hypothetical protein